MTETKLVAPEKVASETAYGEVFLANVNQAYEGTIREGSAISPFTFNRTIAKDDGFGTVQQSTLVDVREGKKHNGYCISPAVLNKVVSSTTETGLVKLADKDIKKSAYTDALTKHHYESLMADITALKKDLESKINDIKNTDLFPVGTIVATYTETPLGKGWIVLNKPTVNITSKSHPKLYDHLKNTVNPVNGVIKLIGTNGKVLRGKNNGEFKDVVESKYNEYVDDTMQKLTGNVNTDDEGRGVVGGCFFVAGWAHGPGKTGGGTNVGFDNSRQARTSEENRPKSLTVTHQIYAGV